MILKGNMFKVVFILLMLSILLMVSVVNSQAENFKESANNYTSNDMPYRDAAESNKDTKAGDKIVSSQQKKPESSDDDLVEKLHSVWFDFQINSRIKYHTMEHFRLKDSKVLFAKGYIASLKYDSLLSSTDVLRDKFVATTDDSEKWVIAKEIIDAEQNLYELMRSRDRLYAEARKSENSVWQNASEEDITSFVKRINADEQRYSELLAAQSSTYSMITPKKKEEVEEAPEKMPDPEEVKSEKPLVAEKKMAPEVAPPDNSIVFMVQIGAFRNYVPESMQKLYNNLARFRKVESFRDNRGYLVYVVGKMSDYNEATGLKKQLMQEGVKDAFVVSYRGDTRIPVGEALKIQNSK